MSFRSGHIVSLGRVQSSDVFKSNVFNFALEGKASKIHELFSSGTDWNVDATNNRGQTALFISCLGGHIKCVKTLLKLSAYPNRRCDDGSTAVHAAAFSCSPAILKAVVERGGDLRLHDDRGLSPRDWAVEAGTRKNREILDLIDEWQDVLTKVLVSPDNANATSQKKKFMFSTSRSEWKGSGSAKSSCLQTKVSSHSLQKGYGDLILTSSFAHIPGQVHHNKGYASLLPIINKNSLTTQDNEPYTSFQAPPYFIQTNGCWGVQKVTIKKVKKLKRILLKQKGSATDLLIAELKINKLMRHHRILLLLGVCLEYMNDSNDMHSKTTNPLSPQCFVYERISLGSLYNLLHEETCTLSLSKLISFLIQVEEGLSYLKQRGIIHCCLSSHAINVVDFHSAKISDFYYSVLSEECSQNHYRVSSVFNRWLAPEILAGKKPSYESDVYGFCSVICEALSGKLPWHGFDPESIRHQVVTKGQVLTVPMQVPKVLHQVLAQGLFLSRIKRTTQLKSLTFVLRELFKSESATLVAEKPKALNSTQKVLCNCDGDMSLGLDVTDAVPFETSIPETFHWFKDQDSYLHASARTSRNSGASERDTSHISVKGESNRHHVVCRTMPPSNLKTTLDTATSLKSNSWSNKLFPKAAVDSNNMKMTSPYERMNQTLPSSANTAVKEIQGSENLRRSNIGCNVSQKSSPSWTGTMTKKLWYPKDADVSPSFQLDLSRHTSSPIHHHISFKKTCDQGLENQNKSTATYNHNAVRQDSSRKGKVTKKSSLPPRPRTAIKTSATSIQSAGNDVSSSNPRLPSRIIDSQKVTEADRENSNDSHEIHQAQPLDISRGNSPLHTSWQKVHDSVMKMSMIFQPSTNQDPLTSSRSDTTVYAKRSRSRFWDDDEQRSSVDKTSGVETEILVNKSSVLLAPPRQYSPSTHDMLHVTDEKSFSSMDLDDVTLQTSKSNLFDEVISALGFEDYVPDSLKKGKSIKNEVNVSHAASKILNKEESDNDTFDAINLTGSICLEEPHDECFHNNFSIDQVYSSAAETSETDDKSYQQYSNDDNEDRSMNDDEHDISIPSLHMALQDPSKSPNLEELFSQFAHRASFRPVSQTELPSERLRCASPGTETIYENAKRHNLFSGKTPVTRSVSFPSGINVLDGQQVIMSDFEVPVSNDVYHTHSSDHETSHRQEEPNQPFMTSKSCQTVSNKIDADDKKINPMLLKAGHCKSSQTLNARAEELYSVEPPVISDFLKRTGDWSLVFSQGQSDYKKLSKLGINQEYFQESDFECHGSDSVRDKMRSTQSVGYYHNKSDSLTPNSQYVTCCEPDDALPTPSNEMYVSEQINDKLPPLTKNPQQIEPKVINYFPNAPTPSLAKVQRSILPASRMQPLSNQGYAVLCPKSFVGVESSTALPRGNIGDLPTSARDGPNGMCMAPKQGTALQNFSNTQKDDTFDLTPSKLSFHHKVSLFECRGDEEEILPLHSVKSKQCKTVLEDIKKKPEKLICQTPVVTNKDTSPNVDEHTSALKCCVKDESNALNDSGRPGDSLVSQIGKNQNNTAVDCATINVPIMSTYVGNQVKISTDDTIQKLMLPKEGSIISYPNSESNLTNDCDNAIPPSNVKTVGILNDFKLGCKVALSDMDSANRYLDSDAHHEHAVDTPTNVATFNEEKTFDQARFYGDFDLSFAKSCSKASTVLHYESLLEKNEKSAYTDLAYDMESGIAKLAEKLTENVLDSELAQTLQETRVIDDSKASQSKSDMSNNFSGISYDDFIAEKSAQENLSDEELLHHSTETSQARKKYEGNDNRNCADAENTCFIDDDVAFDS